MEVALVPWDTIGVPLGNAQKLSPTEPNLCQKRPTPGARTLLADGSLMGDTRQDIPMVDAVCPGPRNLKSLRMLSTTKERPVCVW
eukprot:4485862-Amphidinium_carterae.1